MNLFKVEWDDTSLADDDGRPGEPCVLYVKAESPRDAAEIVHASLDEDEVEEFRVFEIALDEAEGAGIVEMRFVTSVLTSELRKKEGAE